MNEEAILARLEALEKQNAEKEAEIARLREETNRQVGGTGDSLQNDLLEFRKREQDLGGVQSGICLACGETWRNEYGDIRIIHMLNGPGGHSFRSYLNKKAQRPATYRRSEDRKIDPLMPEEVYMTEAVAASKLDMTIPKLRRLIKTGGVKADRIGKVTLVRTSSINGILELANATRELAGVPA